MATGWAAEGAVQDQIDATVKDGVDRAKSRLPQGPSLTHCAECGCEIPEARRTAISGVYVLPVKMPMIVSLHGSPGTTAAAARIANCAEVLRDIHCFRGTGQYAQGSPAGD
jgi:hypothetical protein